MQLNEADYLSDEFVNQFTAKRKPQGYESPRNAKDKTWVKKRDTNPHHVEAPYVTWDPESLDSYKKVLAPYDRQLVSAFVDNGYPHDALSIAFKESVMNKRDISVKDIIGITFERLAYLSLADAMTQNPEMFPDSALWDTSTTTDIFENLEKNIGFLKLSPDGAVVKPGSKPELKSLIEYKIHPSSSSNLNRQLIRMSYFLNTYGETEFQLPIQKHRSADLDFRSLKIGNHANILIVAPQNADCPIMPPAIKTDITFLRVPFYSSLATSLGANIYTNALIQKQP